MGRYQRSKVRSADQSARRFRAFTRFTTVGTPVIAALFGGAIGAIVGQGASLPGIWAGALFGALAGAAAGRAMDVQRGRTSRHDADLDDQIGVTSGSLGRPSVAAGPPPAVERGEVDAQDLRGALLVAPGLGEDPVGVGPVQAAQGPRAVARGRP